MLALASAWGGAIVVASGCGSEVRPGDAIATTADAPSGARVPYTAADATPISPQGVADAAAITCTAPGPALSGAAYWVKQAGEPADTIGSYSINGTAIDANGDVVLVGTFRGTMDLGGDPLSSMQSRFGAVFNDVFVAKFDATGKHLWSERFGDPDMQYGYAIALDAAGNVFLTGSFVGTINFAGTGPSAPETLATHHVPSPGTLDTINNVFVVKLDAQGKHVWSKSFGDSKSMSGGSKIAIDPDGNVVTSGYYDGPIDFAGRADGVGKYDANVFSAYLVKLTNDGSFVWSHSFAVRDQQQFPWDQAVDAQGNVVVVGYFGVEMDTTGDGPDGGGILRTYQPCSVSGCVEDGFVIKLDKAGKVVFGRALGDPEQSLVEGVTTDRAGNVIVAGSYQNGLDILGEDPADGGISWDGSFSTGWRQFVAKLDGTTGARMWGYPFAEQATSNTITLAADGEDNVYLAATIVGSPTFPDLPPDGPRPAAEGVLLARVDPAGRAVWSRTYAGALPAQATALAVDRCANEVFLAGTFRSLLTFDRADGAGTLKIDGTMTYTGSHPSGVGFDLFFARLAR
jgi:hypothetical protein